MLLSRDGGAMRSPPNGLNSSRKFVGRLIQIQHFLSGCSRVSHSFSLKPVYSAAQKMVVSVFCVFHVPVSLQAKMCIRDRAGHMSFMWIPLSFKNRVSTPCESLCSASYWRWLTGSFSRNCTSDGNTSRYTYSSSAPRTYSAMPRISGTGSAS